jgi:hypothetical protein
MPEQRFAYTLSQVDEGWSWSVWDEDGGVVAAGVAPDQPSAERNLSAALAQTRNASSPTRQGPPQRPRSAEPRAQRPAQAGAAHPQAGW